MSSTSSKRRSPTPIFDSIVQLAATEIPPALSEMDSAVAYDDIAEEFRLIKRFLLSYDGSSATFNAYRRDLERLCHWSWLVQESTVCALTRDDIESYIRFTQNPPKAWIGVKNVARFRMHNGLRITNPEWRPFVATVSKKESLTGAEPDTANYAPSHAATKATFTALSSFYDYLISDSLIATNPVKTIRQKSKFIRREQQPSVVRRLSNLQWDYLLETAEKMAADDPDEHERTLFTTVRSVFASVIVHRIPDANAFIVASKLKLRGARQYEVAKVPGPLRSMITMAANNGVIVTDRQISGIKPLTDEHNLFNVLFANSHMESRIDIVRALPPNVLLN